MSFHNRRFFLRKAGIGIAAGALAPAMMAKEYPAIFTQEKGQSPVPELALASYTTRELSLDETIAIAKRLGIRHLGLKSVHLPLDASEADCKTAADKIKAESGSR